MARVLPYGVLPVVAVVSTDEELEEVEDLLAGYTFEVSSRFNANVRIYTSSELKSVAWALINSSGVRRVKSVDTGQVWNKHAFSASEQYTSLISWILIQTKRHPKDRMK